VNLSAWRGPSPTRRDAAPPGNRRQTPARSADGRTATRAITNVLGSPARPLSIEAARTQFDACGGSAALWDAVMALENAADSASLARRKIGYRTPISE